MEFLLLLLKIQEFTRNLAEDQHVDFLQELDQPSGDQMKKKRDKNRGKVRVFLQAICSDQGNYLVVLLYTSLLLGHCAHC